MKKRLVVLLPKYFLSDDKEDVVENLIKYINNEDKDIEIYLKDKLSYLMSEEDIIALSNYMSNAKLRNFYSNDVRTSSVVMKLRKLISDIYAFKIREVKLNKEVSKQKLFMKEYSDRIIILYSKTLEGEIVVDDVYDELYLKMYSSKNNDDKVFYRKLMRNLNMLRVN